MTPPTSVHAASPAQEPDADAPPGNKPASSLPVAVLNWIAQVLARHDKEHNRKDEAA